MNTNPDQTLANLFALRTAMERMKNIPERDASNRPDIPGDFLYLDLYEFTAKCEDGKCASYRCVLGWYCHWIGRPIPIDAHSFAAQHFGIDRGQSVKLFGTVFSSGNLQQRITYLDKLLKERVA